MDFADVITSLGFPAAVAAFALWNSYKHEQFLQDTLKTALDENTQALNELKITCARIVGIRGGDEDDV